MSLKKLQFHFVNNSKSICITFEILDMRRIINKKTELFMGIETGYIRNSFFVLFCIIFLVFFPFFFLKKKLIYDYFCVRLILFFYSTL